MNVLLIHFNMAFDYAWSLKSDWREIVFQNDLSSGSMKQQLNIHGHATQMKQYLGTEWMIYNILGGLILPKMFDGTHSVYLLI